MFAKASIFVRILSAVHLKGQEVAEHIPHGRHSWCVQALCKAASLPRSLLRTLLSPKPLHVASTAALERCGLPASLRAALQAHHNASQQAAIAAALSQSASGFTLVQARLTLDANLRSVPLTNPCPNLQRCIF